MVACQGGKASKTDMGKAEINGGKNNGKGHNRSLAKKEELEKVRLV